MTVGELVIKIAADTSALRRDLEAARAEISAFKDSVGGATNDVNKARSSWLSWGSALKVGIPLVAGAALGVMQMTGGFGSLAGLLPIVTSALGALLAPFTTLAAVAAGFVGPLSVIVMLLGALGGGVFLGVKTALTSGYQGFSQLHGIVDKVEHSFHNLGMALAQDFMPYIIQGARWVLRFLHYANDLAHMQLAQAFHSLATKGVAMVTQMLEQIGHLVAKPIYLAFAIAFGSGAGDNVRSKLGSLWGQVIRFFSQPPAAGKQSITQMIGAWFGRQDFSAIGMRWGMDLAGWLVKGIVLGVQKLWNAGHLGKLLLGGAGGGAAIGFALGGPIGAAMGAAIGAAAGIVLNHYWKPISQTTSQIVAKLKQWYAELNKNKAMSQMLHIIWVDLKATASNLWSVARNILKIIDDLFIKTGAWKIIVVLIVAAVTLVAGGLRIVSGVLSSIVRWVKDAVAWLTNAKNYSNLWRAPINAVASAVSTIAGYGSTIVGWLKTAWSYAERFASAVSSIHMPSLPSIPGGSLLSIIGKHTATGGMLSPGQASVVGERGPELFIPAGAGTVVPNHRSFGGGGGGVTVVRVELHNPLILGDRKTARDTARWLEPELGRIIKAAR